MDQQKQEFFFLRNASVLKQCNWISDEFTTKIVDLLNSNQIFVKEFLGSGSFGAVYSTEDGKCVKFCGDPREDTSTDYTLAKLCLERGGHPMVPTFYGAFKQSGTTIIYREEVPNLNMAKSHIFSRLSYPRHDFPGKNTLDRKITSHYGWVYHLECGNYDKCIEHLELMREGYQNLGELDKLSYIPKFRSWIEWCEKNKITLRDIKDANTGYRSSDDQFVIRDWSCAVIRP